MQRWRTCWVALVLLLCAAVAGAATLPITLSQGTVESTVDGTTRSASLNLPYVWDRHHDGRPGLARFSLPFMVDRAPEDTWGVFILRAGNTLEVWLNGEPIQVFGDMTRSEAADYTKTPLYISIPAHQLNVGANELMVHIRADTGRDAGLSQVVVGPAALVRDTLFEPLYTWRHTGSVLLAGFSAVIGAIALALWVTQVQGSADGARRRQRFYLWAAFAEFGWALRLADGVMTQPPLPWVAWGTLMTACYAAWAASVVMFCHYVARWFRVVGPRTMGGMLALATGSAVAACWLSLAQARPGWFTAWLGVELALVVVYATVFVVTTVRQPDPRRVLMAAVALLTVAVALRDWLVVRVGDGYGDVSWVRYSSVLLGIALLGIVGTRFRQASVQARELLNTLSARVAEREQELASTYARLEQVAREQARVHERERILRDMHDGVGAHISSAIRQLQSGQASNDQLLRTLRDSLDQLKLSIDSIHLPAGDVGALLAGLRYRLAPRLTGSALTLEWAVDELQPVPQLDAPAMRKLQFLLFEAISNVLQHAHAKVLRFEAAMHGPVLRLALVDDGCGFDASRPPRALLERAQAIGARLTLDSVPGRTAVQLEFDT